MWASLLWVGGEPTVGGVPTAAACALPDFKAGGGGGGGGGSPASWLASVSSSEDESVRCILKIVLVFSGVSSFLSVYIM